MLVILQPLHLRVLFMAHCGISWKTVAAYAPVSNGKAERMVGTIKKATGRLAKNRKDWHKHYMAAVRGYRVRPLFHGKSPFELLYGCRPRIIPGGAPVLSACTEGERFVELMSLDGIRATHAKKIEDSRKRVATTEEFAVGCSVLVAYGKALDPTFKWPAFKPKYYGPCTIVKSKHPLYSLTSDGGRRTRTGIHARRLRLYHTRPLSLQ